MYERPKCECGEELEFDFDTDIWCDGDALIMDSHGHCPKCQKKYKWCDYYALTFHSNLQEKTE